MRIEISQIVIPEGRRPLRDVTALTGSMKEVGLLNPITVTATGYRLIAGYHRLEAAKQLGWTTIEASLVALNALDAELAEIDENLIRNESTVLERSEQLKRRKEIYEAKHPETKAGHAQAAGMNRTLGYNVSEMISPTFAQDTASKTNLTARSIQQDIQIATNIPEELREKLRETPLADNKVELLKLARLRPEEQKTVAEKIMNGEATSVRRAKVLEQADAIRREPLPLPTGPFRVIVVDPPWSYDSRADDPTHRAANPYSSMTVEDIKALPVGNMAAEDAILWLWATNAFMHEAYHVAAAWGFEIKTILTWTKDRMGTGDWLRGQTEHCLLAVKGKPVVTLTNQTTIINGPLREHSRKPEEFYALVEELCPGSRVELFARCERKGWLTYGAEIGLFPSMEAA